MTHSYKISGMTCNNCVAKVKSELLKIPDLLSAEVLLPGNATISMQKHIPISTLQNSLSKAGHYSITEKDSHQDMMPPIKQESKSWLITYRPLLLIFAFILGTAIITANQQAEFNWMQFMTNFMAAFFIVFSFFKLLNLKGFAESYSSYDLLAKQIASYGYLYPFIELALGIAYLTKFNLFATDIATIAVMGFSSIGVIQAVAGKEKIQCACLGTVFDLPMSTITIIEDLLMVAMAIIMLIIKK
jgi:cation transport ATPase